MAIAVTPIDATLGAVITDVELALVSTTADLVAFGQMLLAASKPTHPSPGTRDSAQAWDAVDGSPSPLTR